MFYRRHSSNTDTKNIVRDLEIYLILIENSVYLILRHVCMCTSKKFIKLVFDLILLHARSSSIFNDTKTGKIMNIPVKQIQLITSQIKSA